MFCVKHGLGETSWKTYTKNGTGRADFQIDLGLDLMNFGISLDWVGQERPEYVRQRGWTPCDCKKCFFCLNGHTNGIMHAGKQKRAKVVVNYKCGKRMRTQQCVKDGVDLDKGCSYCKMCYRNSKEETAAKKRKASRSSRMGCPICQEHICTPCWESGYDRHAD